MLSPSPMGAAAAGAGRSLTSCINRSRACQTVGGGGRPHAQELASSAYAKCNSFKFRVLRVDLPWMQESGIEPAAFPLDSACGKSSSAPDFAAGHGVDRSELMPGGRRCHGPATDALANGFPGVLQHAR